MQLLHSRSNMTCADTQPVGSCSVAAIFVGVPIYFVFQRLSSCRSRQSKQINKQ
jgi:hypothetical protein